MGAIATKTRLSMLGKQVRAAGPRAVKLYRQILKAGETAEFAAMCALRQAPGASGTDRAFCQGSQAQMESMAPINREAVLARAKRAGIKTQGKFFKGSLGRAEDPAAWVATADDVLAVAKQKNLTIDGAVKHQGVRRDGPPARVRLAPDLVANLECEYVAQDGKLAEQVEKSPKARRELRERIIETHGSKKKG